MVAAGLLAKEKDNGCRAIIGGSGWSKNGDNEERERPKNTRLAVMMELGGREAW